MPRHPDFEKIYQAFMWRFCQDKTECDIGKQHYYSWLNKLGLDDTKPYHSPQEKFSWTEPYIQFLKEDEEAKYFEVETLFPISSMNDNVYLQDELLRGARSLVGKTVNWNHTDALASEVQIYDADYEDCCVECLLKVSKGSKALELIEKGEVLHVSIKANCLRGTEQTPEGNVCRGLVFTGLALLTKDTLPGVPLTRILPVEKLVESFAVTSVTSLEEKAQGLKQVEEPASGETSEKETDIDFQGRIADLENKYRKLKDEFEEFRKPKEEPKKERCGCVLTKEGFWARFHQLRGEGLSKSDAFRLVSLEVLEAASKQK